MGSASYELGRKIGMDKSSSIGGFLYDVGKAGVGKALSKGVGYAKGLAPKFTGEVAGVLSHEAPAGIRAGMRSAGSGVLHGLTGGRWAPNYVVSGKPFRAARAVADVAYRNPGTALSALGEGLPTFYDPETGGMTINPMRMKWTGLGLLPPGMEQIGWGAMGLRGKGALSKSIGALMTASGLHDLYNRGGQESSGADYGVMPYPEQMPQGTYPDQEGLLRAAMLGNYGAQQAVPDYWGQVYGGARNLGRKAYGLMRGQLGSTY